MSREIETFRVPEDVELQQFFDAGPENANGEDGTCDYQLFGSHGLKLRFSFNVFDRSVQTELSMGETVVETVSHEGGVAMTLGVESLTCEFAQGKWRATLQISKEPSMRVEWSTLRVE